MLEQAKKYYEHGISVIPVGANKLPIGAWTQNMKELIEPKWENLNYIIKETPKYKNKL